MAYYDDISVDLGNRFRASFRDRLDTITKRPDSFGRIHEVCTSGVRPDPTVLIGVASVVSDLRMHGSHAAVCPTPLDLSMYSASFEHARSPSAIAVPHADGVFAKGNTRRINDDSHRLPK